MLSSDTFNEVVQIDTDEILTELPGTPVEVLPGSVGKGSSNWGVDVVLTLTNIATIDGLIDLGQRLVKLVKKLNGGASSRHLLLRDPSTAGVLAVGAYEPRADLKGGVVQSSWCVSGGNSGIGFDARDLWITSVEKRDQSILLIATSPSGEVLGSWTIPKWY
jgi:hypothetical protein